MRCGDPQGCASRNRLLHVQDDRHAPASRCGTDRRDEVRIMIVGQHAIDIGNQPFGIVRLRHAERRIAVMDDGPTALRVDKDGGDGRGLAIDPHAVATDACRFQAGQDAVPHRIVSAAAAKRACKTSHAAEPYDRDRRIGGAAADYGGEFERPRLFVVLRESGDPEHLVENGDPCAENARADRSGPSAYPLAPASSTHERMM